MLPEIPLYSGSRTGMEKHRRDEIVTDLYAGLLRGPWGELLRAAGVVALLSLGLMMMALHGETPHNRGGDGSRRGVVVWDNLRHGQNTDSHTGRFIITDIKASPYTG